MILTMTVNPHQKKNIIYSKIFCYYCFFYSYFLGFPGGSAVKNPSAMQEMQGTWVQLLGGEDPLKKGMGTHSSILAWRIPTEEPGGIQSARLQTVRHH